MKRHATVRLGPTDSIPRARTSPLPVLLQVVNADPSQRVRLAAGKFVIGTAPDVGLVLADTTVSRRHAEVEVVADGLRVRDLGSRNGTFYLGSRVGEITVPIRGCLVVGRTELRVEVDADELSSQSPGPEVYGQLWGSSAQMRRLTGLLKRLEGSLVSVLVCGESGTGKELVARAIHDHSHVANGPFVAINCGALNRSLAQSELFGHRRGAFTGAIECRRGAFEAAHGGTLFLDEIAELPLDVQPLLLRTLQERNVTRVGEHESRSVNVRVIAATHRNLEREVAESRFREDLYYRLRVAELHVPALRQRAEDIELLARHFAKLQGCAELPEDMVAQLLIHQWPGNVRELQHCIEAFVALGEMPALGRRNNDDLAPKLAQLLDLSQPYEVLKQSFQEQFQRAYLSALLERSGGNISQAARESGLDRSYLGKVKKRLNLSS